MPVLCMPPFHHLRSNPIKKKIQVAKLAGVLGPATPFAKEAGSCSPRPGQRVKTLGKLWSGALRTSSRGRSAFRSHGSGTEVSFGPSTIEKLTDLGAILESCASFRDSYYDVPDWCLTRADHWLREREGVGWELKCPLVVGAVRSDTPCAAETDNHLSAPVSRPLKDMRSSTASQYQEVTCPQNLVTRLCGLLERDPGPNWSCCVNKAVEELGLQVFASFVTMRRKYRVGDLHVDLDEVDFGYTVGEVEAMVQRLEDIPEALEKIEKFSKQLGLEEKTAIPGKMSVYLQRFRPAHYKALMGAGVVKKVINTTEG